MINSLQNKISKSVFKNNKKDHHYLYLVILFSVVITFPAYLHLLPYPVLFFDIIIIVFIVYGLLLLERLSVFHILSGVGTIILFVYSTINSDNQGYKLIHDEKAELFLLICYLILTGKRLLQETISEEVSLKLIYISISNYLTIGLMFAFIYKLLHLSEPNSFNFMVQHAYQHIYFSFVILTSTGLGDILPLSNSAKSLVVLEAITGQLYLTFFVAIVIGKYLSPKSN